MSSHSPKKVAAILLAATAGAGAIAAAPLMADQGDRPGDGFHHLAPPPPPPGMAPADAPPGPGQQGQPGGRALQPGDDNASPRVAGGDTWQAQGTRRGRSFRVTCDYVTQGMFDPIVAPGVDPAGHDHQFFGGLSIAPGSTPATLVAANAGRTSTSCRQTADGSAYWMPALQVTDSGSAVTVEPDEMRVRYSAPRGQRRVRAFPVGFTMIAGSKSATTLQQYAGWRCEFDAPGTALQASPPQCAADEDIVGVVRFPNCWDGTTLSVQDPTNQSHVAYRVGTTCPTTHPVALPELVEEAFWPTDGQPHSYALSSGNTAGLHADFMNGWDQRALRNQVRRWLNRRA